MTVYTYSLAPTTIIQERKEDIISGKSKPQTFQEFQYWIYDYLLHQQFIDYSDLIIQELVVLAGGKINKKTTFLGDVYYSIIIVYDVQEPENWMLSAKNIINKYK